MEITRHWRLKAQRYRLEGSVCPACGKVMFPPRPLCPQCADLQGRTAGPAFLVLPAMVLPAPGQSSGARLSLQLETTERLTG